MYKKNKVQSRFGKIDVSQSHDFSHPCQGYRISPYLQYMMSLMATDLVYSEAARLLGSFLGIEISTSQTYRVAVSAGEALAETSLYEPLQPAPEDKVYALADGSMISTDDGWKELKLGRVFLFSRRY